MAKVEKTNEGREGGYLKGDLHSDPSGGIKTVVTDNGNKPILVESDEVIINRKAVLAPGKKTLTGTNKEILHQINTSTGGKPILKDGGSVSDTDHDDLYSRWKSLVNMSVGELSNFLKTEEGKEAGLSSSEAKSQGISSGHESARWIIRMKNTPRSQWKNAEWKWAGKQVSFISRMSGNAGPLYDDKGNKTRKHTSLLLWGHNPEKKGQGGDVNDSDTDKIRARWYYHRQHIYEKLVELNGKSQWRWFDRLTASDKWDKPMVRHANEQIGLVDVADLEFEEKISNFTLNITKDEIDKIISGPSERANGDLIQTIASILTRGKSSSIEDKDSKFVKRNEEELLKKFAFNNELIKSQPKESIYLSEGCEQKVFLVDGEIVLKQNDAIFYSTWLEYFQSIQLHNLFFPATAYSLVGFCREGDKFFALVTQKFVANANAANLSEVKSFMELNGFVNTKNNDYYNPDLEIILEDLHEENVLEKDGILCFIDTVFYRKKKEIKMNKSVKELLLSDGDNENDYIVEGTKITTGEGPAQDTWEIVTLTSENITVKHLPKSSLGSSAGERTITYDQLREDFTKNAIQISGINSGDTRCLNLCIKAIKQALGQEEYARGGKIKGDKGKVTGKQYGYTLKEYEDNYKDDLFVSPEYYWKTQLGTRYKDSMSRNQQISERDKDRIMGNYAYKIMIGIDLGSDKIPASAKEYAEKQYELKNGEISVKLESGGPVELSISKDEIDTQIAALKIAIEEANYDENGNPVDREYVNGLQDQLDALEILKEAK